MLTGALSLLLILSIGQIDSTPASSIRNMTVSQGLYHDMIVVEWDKTDSVSYSVLRSQFKTGDFSVVAETSDQKFEDRDIERGVKYWYKVIPSPELTYESSILINPDEYNIIPEPLPADTVVKDQLQESGKMKNDAAENGAENVKNTGESENEGADVISGRENSYSGYTSIDNSPSLTLADLMKLKKGKLKIPVSAAAKKKQKKVMDYLDQYYMNPVKLSLFMRVAKPYIDKGELKIFTDCDSYEIKKELNQVVFFGRDYSYMAVFESKKILRIIRESGDEDLEGILIKNSDLFCLPNGKAFIVDKNGITRLVNSYDAVGISTGYVKHDSDWKRRTIMTATSRSDLKDKLKNASGSNSN